MGLKVTGSFTTAEGIDYTSVYVKLHTVICEFAHATAETVNISAHFLVFLNRARRDQGFAFAMAAPPFERILGYTVPTTDLSGAFLGGLYARYTAYLIGLGYTVEDVLEPAPEPAPEPTPEASPQSSESTPSTLPTPPTPSESVPPESQPEPQPQSSSEYAPAPAASEA